MTDHKKAVELIFRIEQDFDVNSVTCNGIKIWPLVRQYIWVCIAYPEKKTSFETNRLASNVFLKDAYSITKCIYRQLKYSSFFNITKNKIEGDYSADFIFFSRHEDYHNKYNNMFFNTLIDPLIQHIHEKYKYVKLEILSKTGIGRIPRVENTYFIDPLYEFYRKPKYFLSSFKMNYSIINFGRLSRFVSEITDEVKLSEQYFIVQAIQIDKLTIGLKKILEKINPKIVFLICYYSMEAMALIRACRVLNIRSVELQHGKQGSYQSAYSHWSKIPEQGYELLPDFFWVWGQEAKHNIQRWQPSNLKRNIPVVGGNPWLSQWTSGDNSHGFCDEYKEFLSSLNHYKKRILYTVQPLAKLFPDHLLSAMQSSPKNWIWLIRLHPHHDQRRRAEEISAYLRAEGVANFEINSTSHIFLFSILQSTDHHLTCWSSVCYESLYFNVPTTIVHPTGKQLFEYYIDKGIFHYADSDKKVLELISKSTSQNMIQEEESYIEADLQKADDAINQILQYHSK